MSSRRRFLGAAAGLPLAQMPSITSSVEAPPIETERISLDGRWLFRLDPKDTGLTERWQLARETDSWRPVSVPHTWQIEAENAEYRGIGWYRRTVYAHPAWTNRSVRVEFEAVFHTATVWVNGVEAGRHAGKGYTAFTVDIGRQLKAGAENMLVVRVDNSFNESMLPRGKSSDWAHDGGLYRPVSLLVTPHVFIERVAVDADPDLRSAEGTLDVTAVVRNGSDAAWEGAAGCRVVDKQTGMMTLQGSSAPVKIGPGERTLVTFAGLKMRDARLWHFDHPNLYVLSVQLSNGHCSTTHFGVRKIETRNGGFYLNGERVRLMGVERMAGSNPEFGMAEPASWVEHDHADMKELNCVYTRVHWQQDRRVLDWCDRHGMLIQTEVPTWGGGTFRDMAQQPSPDILDNGMEQLREMIERDRNHPCIFSWGVCNEINGQNPPAYAFAKQLYEEAKRLDPKRLVTYASNSLQKTPEKDVAGLMDYIMWNEYYESWYRGTPDDLARNLDEIHAAFPDKAIVISEYGYCACTAERPEGDAKRMQIVREHDEIFRKRDYVAGLIFFDYNDYRTHIGDRGTGVMKQRVHGVVDLYGAKKGSWAVLRQESSPVESIRVSGSPAALEVRIRTRAAVPAYTLRGYEIRAIAYGFGRIPVERVAAQLETAAPGESRTATLKFTQTGISQIRVDLMRPTGFSVSTEIWGF